MVKTEIFIATRKRLKLSQVALSAGICTQATLSKFEKHQQIPTIDIMGALCARLGLTLDDIFSLSPPMQSQVNQGWAELLAAFGHQNQPAFHRLSQSLMTETLTVPMAIDVMLMRYFSAVCWQPDLRLATQLIGEIDLKLASAQQQYLFYAITVHYYVRRHQDDLAAATYHDLMQRQARWVKAPYGVLMGTVVYLMAQYQFDVGEMTAATETAAIGITAAQKHDSTAFVENFFWLLYAAGKGWQQPQFVRQEVLLNARLLAKLHGNNQLLQIMQQRGEK